MRFRILLVALLSLHTILVFSLWEQSQKIFHILGFIAVKRCIVSPNFHLCIIFFSHLQQEGKYKRLYVIWRRGNITWNGLICTFNTCMFVKFLHKTIPKFFLLLIKWKIEVIPWFNYWFGKSSKQANKYPKPSSWVVKSYKYPSNKTLLQYEV